MCCALHDEQRIRRRILLGDIPGLLAESAQAADRQTLSLPERVKGEPAMLSNRAPTRFLDRTRLERQILTEKFAEPSFTDEADPRAVFLMCAREIGGPRPGSDFALEHFAEREDDAIERARIDAVQKIALILGGISAFE